MNESLSIGLASGSTVRSLLVRGGRLIDPGQGIDEVGDLLVESGRVVEIIRPEDTRHDPSVEKVLDATGAVVTPGFVDIHAHLRYPGFPDKETIASGTFAAIRGGFTTVYAMANTKPPVDSAIAVEEVQAMVAREGRCQVGVIGAVSRGLEGHENTDAEELVQAGAVALSDDGNPVMDPSVMTKALQASERLGIAVSAHEEVCDRASARRDPCWPCSGEIDMIRRDLKLLERHGGHLHVAHVSCEDSVELIAEAQTKGLRVTAEVTPHHLDLSGTELEGPRLPPNHPNAKVNPPLRSDHDIRTLRAGLVSNVLSAVATDHAPHASTEKTAEFDTAAFGFTGFELALPLLVRLVRAGVLTLPQLVERLTIGPARAFDLRAGTLEPGQPAHVCVFDPDKEWQPARDTLASKGKNTPVLLQPLTGRVLCTVVGERLHTFGGDHELRALRAS